MKTIAKNLFAAAIAFITLSAAAPQAQATDVVLQGYSSYNLGAVKTYRAGGAAQSGRYTNLGRGYYRSSHIYVDRVTNRSTTTRSGSLSMELWAMPFYGASYGATLVTSGLGQLNRNSYFYNVNRYGSALFLNSYRIPEMNLFEYTNRGWGHRSTIRFSSWGTF
jgi:hypothetical protein